MTVGFWGVLPAALHPACWLCLLGRQHDVEPKPCHISGARHFFHTYKAEHWLRGHATLTKRLSPTRLIRCCQACHPESRASCRRNNHAAQDNNLPERISREVAISHIGHPNSEILLSQEYWVRENSIKGRSRFSVKSWEHVWSLDCHWKK